MARLPKPVDIVKRGKVYRLHYYNPDGLRRRLTVGSDFHHAQRLAFKYTDWLLGGKDPEREMERAKQNEKAKQLTLREFFPEFMERHGRFQSRKMQSAWWMRR